MRPTTFVFQKPQAIDAKTRHELRTPLSAIILQLESLERQLEDADCIDVHDRARMRVGVTRALRQAERLGRTLQDLLSRPN
jgi:signal transduction histidine kinase